MNINQPQKAPWKIRSYLLCYCIRKKYCRQDTPQPISNARMNYHVTGGPRAAGNRSPTGGPRDTGWILICFLY